MAWDPLLLYSSCNNPGYVIVRLLILELCLCISEWIHVVGQRHILRLSTNYSFGWFLPVLHLTRDNSIKDGGLQKDMIMWGGNWINGKLLLRQEREKGGFICYNNWVNLLIHHLSMLSNQFRRSLCHFLLFVFSGRIVFHSLPSLLFPFVLIINNVTQTFSDWNLSPLSMIYFNYPFFEWGAFRIVTQVINTEWRGDIEWHLIVFGSLNFFFLPSPTALPFHLQHFGGYWEDMVGLFSSLCDDA